MSDAPTPDSPCKLVDLGTDVLTQVVLSLSHVQWAHLAPVCRVLRAVVADARAACAHAEPATLQLTAPVLSRTLGDGLLSRVLGLRSLALRGVAAALGGAPVHCSVRRKQRGQVLVVYSSIIRLTAEPRWAACRSAQAGSKQASAT